MRIFARANIWRTVMGEPLRHVRTGSDPRVVVLVGFPPLRHSRSRRAFFERCGLRAIECPDVDGACEFLELLLPDVIVLDTHSKQLRRLSASVTRLLTRLASAADPKPRIIVLSSMRLPQQLRKRYVDAGDLVSPPYLQTLRRLVRLAREQAGLPDVCCVDKRLAASAAERPSTWSA
jgi:hypothetical protein